MVILLCSIARCIIFVELVARGREREIENSKKYWHSSLKSTEDDISTTG